MTYTEAALTAIIINGSSLLLFAMSEFKYYTITNFIMWTFVLVVCSLSTVMCARSVSQDAPTDVEDGKLVITSKNRTDPKYFYIIVFMASVFIAVLAILNTRYTQNIGCTKCQIKAEVTSNPIRGDQSQTFEVSPVGIDDTLILVTTNRTKIYTKGDIVKLEGSVVEANKNKLDWYREYLTAKNISGTMLYPKVFLIASSTNIFSKALEEGRGIISSSMPRPESVIAVGVIFGNIEKSSALSDKMTDAGLSHITALSGYNVGVLLVIVSLLTLRSNSKKIKLLTIVIVLAFFQMINPEPSIRRAVYMAIIILTAQLIYRKCSLRLAFLYSYLIIIVSSPQLVLESVGFHLSCLCIGSILYIVMPLQSKHPKYLKENSIVLVGFSSVVVSVVISPYLITTFGQTNIFSPILTMIALPITPLLTFSLLLTLSLKLLHVYENFMSIINYSLAQILVYLANSEWHTAGQVYLADISKIYSMVFYYSTILLSLKITIAANSVKKLPPIETNVHNETSYPIKFY